VEKTKGEHGCESNSDGLVICLPEAWREPPPEAKKEVGAFELPSTVPG